MYHGWRTDLILLRFKELHPKRKALKMKIKARGLPESMELCRLTMCIIEMRSVLKYRGVTNIKEALRDPANLVWSCPVKEVR